MRFYEILESAVDPAWEQLAKEKAEALEAFHQEGTRVNLQRVWAAQKAEQDYQELHYPTPPSVPTNVEGYAGEHAAPMHDSGSPLYDVTKNGTYPADFYTGRSSDYVQEPEDQRVIGTILAARNRPNLPIKIYRSIPKNLPRAINVGDWVAIERRYAISHGRDNLRNDYLLVSKTVYARDIFTAGDSLQEWGYDPQPRVVMPPRQRRPQPIGG